jgi:hypothetical protein
MINFKLILSRVCQSHGCRRGQRLSDHALPPALADFGLRNPMERAKTSQPV